jgi:hypothetical protein
MRGRVKWVRISAPPVDAALPVVPVCPDQGNRAWTVADVAAGRCTALAS